MQLQAKQSNACLMLSKIVQLFVDRFSLYICCLALEYYKRKNLKWKYPFVTIWTYWMTPLVLLVIRNWLISMISVPSVHCEWIDVFITSAASSNLPGPQSILLYEEHLDKLLILIQFQFQNYSLWECFDCKIFFNVKKTIISRP